MKQIKAKNSILFLIASILALALAYTLEINQVEEGRALLIEERQSLKELGLLQQTALEQLSLVDKGKDLSRIQIELNLEQAKGFTLLHPRPNELSLNRHLYEL